MQLEFRKVKAWEVSPGMQIRKYEMIYTLRELCKTCVGNGKMGGFKVWLVWRAMELMPIKGVEDWAPVYERESDYIHLFEKEKLEVVSTPVRVQAALPID